VTPEELAVVQAAMVWRYAVLAHPEEQAGPVLDALVALGSATYALAVSCPQCNAGGHTCPGDGNHIPHGATDCGEHSEPALIWVARTWADVRIGDRVRMIGSDAPPALVQTCVHLHWHADPRSSQYRPEPLEWTGVRVTLSPGDSGVIVGPYEMDPLKLIEIEIGENEFHILNALGWENRVAVIRDDAS
jgi:hypothetical protein